MSARGGGSRRETIRTAGAAAFALILLAQAGRLVAAPTVVLMEPVPVGVGTDGATISGEVCLVDSSVSDTLGQQTVSVYNCDSGPGATTDVPLDQVDDASRSAAGLPARDATPIPAVRGPGPPVVRAGRAIRVEAPAETPVDEEHAMACTAGNVALPDFRANPPSIPGVVSGPSSTSAAPLPGQGLILPGGVSIPSAPLVVNSLPNSGTLASTAGNQAPQNLASIVRITNTAAQAEFLDSVLASSHGVRSAILADDRLLNQPYKDLPIQALGAYLERARDGLSSAASALLDAESGLDKGELRRFGRTFLDAGAKAEAGAALLRDAASNQASLGAIVPFESLSGPRAPSALSRSAALAEIFGGDPALQAAATADGLLNRLIQLNGLPPEQRAALFQKLQLAETIKLKLPSGQVTSIEILHNGYVFGGSATGMDCSSFVSSTLPTEVRKGRLTTLDFRTMWVFKRSGNFPYPPSYPKDRRKLIQKVAEGFISLDIYNGDKLAIGDLLVFRPGVGVRGHVFVVRGYNPRSLIADVIEASQSAGTIRERPFPLSTSPTQAKVRLLRPGLLALRLKPQNNEVCSFRPGGGTGSASQGAPPTRAVPTRGGTSGASD